MTDISEPALAKGIAKAKDMAPHRTGKVDTMKCDVTKEADVQAVVECLDEWGGVDVMFNNAGIMHGEDDGMPVGRFRKHMITLLTTTQTPFRHQRRSGISHTTSTSKESGLVASMPCSHFASTRRPKAASSTPPRSSPSSAPPHHN